MASPSAMFIIIIFVILGLNNLSYQTSSQTIPYEDIVRIFDNWMFKYARVYKDLAEKEMRFTIFKENAELVEAFSRGGNKGFNLTLNNFADLTDEEFQDFYTGYSKSSKAYSPGMSMAKNDTFFKYANLESVPSSIDWRKKGAVTPVKDQGQCGQLHSCFDNSIFLIIL